MQADEGKNLLRLFPTPGERVPLHGLYLSERFGPPSRRSKSFVYTNFITSLDGRISLPDPQTMRRAVPRAIANARDWRLFQELAARADALVISASHVRAHSAGVSARSFPVSANPEYEDLLQWRRAQGLSPQPAIVIVTTSLALPPLGGLAASGRRVYVATGRAADPRKAAAVESQGVRVLRVGSGARVEGGRLVEALAREGHGNVAVIGGGQVLQALVVDDVLDRLYLTLSFRLLGGLSFDTLLTGPMLELPTAFELAALHYDAGAADGSHAEQLFAVLDRCMPQSAQALSPRSPRD